MPSSLRGPKTLSRWLELDYFNRPRKLRRLWAVVLLATLFASVAAALGWALPPGQRKALQAGPVSTGHSLFANDCNACHQQAWGTLNRLFGLAPDRSVPDSACTQCHSGATHQTTQIGEQRCASCHKEHRGHKPLARVEDGHCTSCHADLKRDDGKEPRYDPHVTAFAKGQHPDTFHRFKGGPPSDPGKLRFNHKAHLAKAGVMTIDRDQVEKLRKQVEKQGGVPYFEDLTRDVKPFQQLDCQSCHRPDASGRFMLPIDYDRHCRSCHPPLVQLVGSWKEPRLETLARSFGRRPAPHPSRTQTPEVVRGALRDRLTRFVLANKQFVKGTLLDDLPRPFPGSGRGQGLSKGEHEWVNEQQGQVERLLFDGAGGCRFCHTEKSRKGGLPEYLPTQLPERWHEHASFGHKAHLMLACAECHEGATTSSEAKDVLLPGMDKCFACHSTEKKKARSDCVECHTYHDGKARHEFHGNETIERFGR